MIARVWHGATKPEHADAYEAMLKPELLPGISKEKGYRGSYLLRRDQGVATAKLTSFSFCSLLIRVATSSFDIALLPNCSPNRPPLAPSMMEA